MARSGDAGEYVLGLSFLSRFFPSASCKRWLFYKSNVGAIVGHQKGDLCIILPHHIVNMSARLSADLILVAPQYTNPLKNRELDLRGRTSVFAQCLPTRTFSPDRQQDHHHREPRRDTGRYPLASGCF